MYTSTVIVPLITADTFAQLEMVAPGITSFNGMQLVTNEDEALAFARQQVQDVLKWNETVDSDAESITVTATGWVFQLRVCESGADRRNGK